jgi:hypothetical protein
MLKVVQLVLHASVKVLLPLGIFDRYGLFGVGVGLNINFSKSMFVGLEGKYI